MPSVPAGNGAQSAPARPQGPAPLTLPRPRNTLVLLPTEPDAHVPDWVFERTGAEMKAAFMAARSRRDLDQVRTPDPTAKDRSFWFRVGITPFLLIVAHIWQWLLSYTCEGVALTLV